MQRLPQHLLLRGWSEYASGEEKAPTTIAQYRYWVVKFSADRQIDLHDATLDDVSGFLARLRGPSRSQAKRALRHFYRWMRVTGRIPADPTELMPRYRRRRRVPHYLSTDELTRLVYTAACHRPEWAWSFLLVFATGARIGEACRIRPVDVDLAQAMVRIRGTKTGWDRVVHLGPTGLAAAAALLDSRPTLLGVSPSALRLRLRKMALRARIPEAKAHPHALRHTCGTQLSERGATQAEIMEHLGHVDPAMSAHYVHVTSERARRVAGLL